LIMKSKLRNQKSSKVRRRRKEAGKNIISPKSNPSWNGDSRAFIR